MVCNLWLMCMSQSSQHIRVCVYVRKYCRLIHNSSSCWPWCPKIKCIKKLHGFINVCARHSIRLTANKNIKRNTAIKIIKAKQGTKSIGKIMEQFVLSNGKTLKWNYSICFRLKVAHLILGWLVSNRNFLLNTYWLNSKGAKDKPFEIFASKIVCIFFSQKWLTQPFLVPSYRPTIVRTSQYDEHGSLFPVAIWNANVHV